MKTDPQKGRIVLLIFRPNHCKLGSNGSHKILTKDNASNRISEEALANAEIIINKLSEKKNRYKINNKQRVPSELKKNLKSLEDKEGENSVMPTSTISSNCRKNLKSRQSSRGSRNRSSSNNKPGQKFVITKSKKGTKSKNFKKLEKYKIPFEKEKQ